MTTESPRRLGLWLIGAGAFGVAVWALATHRNRAQPVRAPSASVSTSAAAPIPPLAPHVAFEFDCGAFAPADADCAHERTPPALLEVSNHYRVGGMPCEFWFDPENGKAALDALRAAEALDSKKLPLLERALLQNAALELWSCASRAQPEGPAGSIAKRASALVKRFTLSAGERDQLPKSEEIVSAWLHDPAKWQRGIGAPFMHTRSEGYARLHTQLEQNDTVADLVRLVLLDENGQPVFTDTVQRVALRRKESDRIRVCIAELDPLCSSGSPLRALPKPRQELALNPPLSSPCSACHVNHYRPSGPFGPSTGVQPSDAAEATIRSELAKLL